MGREFFDNGAEYFGLYTKNIKEDMGEMTMPNGWSYDGFWVQNKFFETGVIKMKDGKEYIDGFFVDGLLNGEGKWAHHIYDEWYKGEWKDNKPSGKGTYVWRSGAKYEGQFVEGKQ